jgi:hypothetical protein
MAEVYLDRAAVTRAAGDLVAVGGSAPTPLPGGAPWGADEAGAAFARCYVPSAALALATWSSVASALERLGEQVLAASSSTMDADEAAARRFAS